MKKNEIVLLISSLRGGGSEEICVTLSNYFNQEGWSVEVWVLNLKNSVLTSYLEPGITLLDLGISRASRSTLKLRNILQEKKPQNILLFEFDLLIPYYLATIFSFKPPFCIYYNPNTISRDLKMKQRRWFEPILYRLGSLFFKKVDVIVQQGEGTYRDFQRLYPNLKDKNIIFPNPLKWRYASLDLPSPKKENLFIMVGRLENQKAHEYGIRAFKLFLLDYPDYRLAIIGSGSRHEFLMQVIAEEDLNGKVEIIPYSHDLPGWYRKAKGVLLSSLYEGFPNVLIESLHFGTPVVSFDCPSGPNEMIQEGVNGYLVSPGDIVAMAEKMKMLVNNLPDIEQVRATAVKFHPQQVGEMYKKLLL